MRDPLMRAAVALQTAIVPMLRLLPAHMDSTPARVLLLAACYQESKLQHRDQLDPRGALGPALGLAQFELGDQRTRGGVWGIYLHSASRNYLSDLCRERVVAFAPRDIWVRLKDDDVLAVGCARLLLWTHPKPLPAVGRQREAYEYYDWCWRPGVERPGDWPESYRVACQAVLGPTS